MPWHQQLSGITAFEACAFPLIPTIGLLGHVVIFVTPYYLWKTRQKRCGLEKGLFEHHESPTTISYVCIAGCLVFKLKLDCAHIMQKDHLSILSRDHGHTSWLQLTHSM